MTEPPRLMPVGPFALPGNWYKGALHVHTNFSDAAQSPAQVLSRYREAGYHFVAVTDHRRLNPVQSQEGMLVLSGIELDTVVEDPKRSMHFVGLGVKRSPERELKTAQEMRAWLRKEATFRMTGHPYWSNLSGGDVASFSDMQAMEVFSTVSEVRIARGCSEQAWDYALSTGMKLLGTAVDDSHQKVDDLGKAWVMVKAAELSVESILTALADGNFYSSTGPEILEFASTDRTFVVRTSPCATLTFVCNPWYGHAFHALPGTALNQARYRLEGPESYLRLQCTDSQGGRAWSNPVYLQR